MKNLIKIEQYVDDYDINQCYYGGVGDEKDFF